MSSNVIILNIFKTNDVGKTHLNTKNKTVENFRMSRDQIPLKDRSTLASSISIDIHLAHPGHAQMEIQGFPNKMILKLVIFMCAPPMLHLLETTTTNRVSTGSGKWLKKFPCMEKCNLKNHGILA